MNSTPLPTAQFPALASLELVRRTPPAAIDFESPARSVMTDLRQSVPIVIAPQETLAQAERRMIEQSVRLLFVVAELPHVLGIVTLDDLKGEKPLRLVYQRQARHGDLRIADVMQPLAQLDTLELKVLERASIGQLVATLLEFGHHYLLVVEPDSEDAKPRVRGLVSLAQIERQLGRQLPAMEIAATFAQIGQALA